MRPNVTDTLCTECGLCCDGSLFSDVELSNGKEISRLEILGLSVEDGDGVAGGLLLQPCTALQGKRCGIYQYRPRCCRTFECRLLKQVLSGQEDEKNARATIAIITDAVRGIKTLMGDSNDPVPLPLRERYLETLSALAEHPSTIAQTRTAELIRRMRNIEKLITKTFLK